MKPTMCRLFLRTPLLRSFFLSALLCLCGCSSLIKISAQNEPAFHKPEFKQSSVVDSQPFSEKEKPLPEMQASDFERAGDNHLRRGDYSKAFFYYGKALELAPERVNLLYKKGLALVSAEKNRESLPVFQEVLKKDPTHAPAIAGKGRALYQMGKYPEAETQFKKALAIDSTLWQAYNYLGLLYDQKKQHSAAIEEYRKAVALKPGFGFLYNNLGVSNLLKGNERDAAIAFQKAIRTGYAEPRVYNNLGLVLCRSGRYAEALEVFKRGASHPSQAYNNLGSIYLEENKIPEAIQCFRKAIEISPTFYTTASRNLDRAESALASASNPF